MNLPSGGRRPVELDQRFIDPTLVPEDLAATVVRLRPVRMHPERFVEPGQAPPRSGRHATLPSPDRGSPSSDPCPCASILAPVACLTSSERPTRPRRVLCGRLPFTGAGEAEKRIASRRRSARRRAGERVPRAEASATRPGVGWAHVIGKLASPATSASRLGHAQSLENESAEGPVWAGLAASLLLFGAPGLCDDARWAALHFRPGSARCFARAPLRLSETIRGARSRRVRVQVDGRHVGLLRDREYQTVERSRPVPIVCGPGCGASPFVPMGWNTHDFEVRARGDRSTSKWNVRTESRQRQSPVCGDQRPLESTS